MAYSLMGLYEQIKAALAERPQITLAKISKEFRVERHTLERAVRICGGTTFRDLRCAALTATAKQLLIHEPAMTVTEVAECLGYASAQGLTRILKRKGALGASAYRKAVGGAELP